MQRIDYVLIFFRLHYKFVVSPEIIVMSTQTCLFAVVVGLAPFFLFTSFVFHPNANLCFFIIFIFIFFALKCAPKLRRVVLRMPGAEWSYNGARGECHSYNVAAVIVVAYICNYASAREYDAYVFIYFIYLFSQHANLF